MRTNIIKEKHCGSLGGHFGVEKTLEQVRRYYYWPKMQSDVRKFVEKCVFVEKPRVLVQMKVFTNHFQFQIGHGNPSTWTLCWSYPKLKGDLIVCLLL